MTPANRPDPRSSACIGGYSFRSSATTGGSRS